MTRPLSEILATLEEGVDAFRGLAEMYREHAINSRAPWTNNLKAAENAAMAQKLEAAIREVEGRLALVDELEGALRSFVVGGAPGWLPGIGDVHTVAVAAQVYDEARTLLAKVEGGR